MSNNIFKEPIRSDDPLWMEYVEKAASFDQRIIEDWNKIVDVTLIFVGLLISVLASFVVNTSTQFQRDPADISNDLLVAIYKQLVAVSNNSSIPVINTTAVFQQDSKDYHNAVICNTLLYSSLGLCTIASMFALAAKLWLINYGHHASSIGTPYERAMKRQKAYSGVLAWKMGAVIQSLPLIVLVAFLMFGLFIHVSIQSTQRSIGYGVATLIKLGFIGLGVTSLAGAFIPACPFHSSFSTIVQLFFTNPQQLFRSVIRHATGTPFLSEIQWLRTGTLGLFWLGSGSLIAWATIVHSGVYAALLYISGAVTFRYSVRGEATHKPQKYRLPHLLLGSFLIIAPMLAVSGYFRTTQKYHIFIVVYIVGMLVLLLFGLMASRLSKSMDATAEIDAIIWLLASAPTPSPELFKKAGRINSGPDSCGYQPRLLNSLMPLLTPLIISYCSDMPEQDLEIYLSCLSHLSHFKDKKGSIWRLKEDAMSHPKLEEQLRRKLVELAAHQSSVGRAATEVLDHYGLDGQGRQLMESRNQEI